MSETTQATSTKAAVAAAKTYEARASFVIDTASLK